MPARKKRKKKKYFLNNFFFLRVFLVILFYGAFLAVGRGVYHSQNFAINRDSFGSELEISADLVRRLEGRPIFSLDLTDIYFWVKRNNPEYKKIKVVKRFPNRIVIEAKKRKPKAQIGSKKFYLIDKEAVVISPGSSNFFKGYPLIINVLGNRYPEKGESFYSEAVEVAFRAIKAIKKEGVISEINSLSPGFEFKLGSIDSSNLPVVYFYLASQKLAHGQIEIIINRRELEEKISLLRRILSEKLSDRVPLVRYIDFRFKNVVIGFQR